MTDITAEALTASAAVRLTITAPAGIRTLVRRDANGINNVRTGPGVIGVVPPAGENFVVTDYEPASGVLRYDLTDQAGTLVSLEVSGFVLDGPWLFTPVIPGYSRKVVAVTGLDTALEDRSTVFSGLLGRRDPVVVLRPPGLRSGALEIYAGTYADALDILSPLRQAAVMMLRQPEHPGMDMYFAPAGGNPQIMSLVTDAGRTVWGVKVPYIEVKRPEGNLAGALGWTYSTLLEAAPRYADLPRTFATYADMRINKRIV